MTASATHNRRAADLFLALVFAIITQLEIWVFTLRAGHDIGTRAGASVLVAVACIALTWRRSHPVPVWWVNFAAVGGTIMVGYSSDIYQWTNLIALYSVAAFGPDPQRWFALPAGVAGVIYYFVQFPFAGGPALAAFISTLWVVGWLVGRIYGARLDEIQLRHEADLARQLAEANEQRLALEEERMRIARELHDIIGHTVNVMVVHAGAGRREIGGDERLVRQAFDTIERTGRSALGEMDRVLALLRGDTDEADRLPAPGMADLEDLAATFAATGLAVDVDVAGNGPVPPSVGLAVYRIAQEALTNTLRHGEATRVVMAVKVGDGHIEVSVADDGAGDPAAIEPGRGIAGMTERAGVHGGTVAIDRSELDGIVVRASLSWEPGT